MGAGGRTRRSVLALTPILALAVLVSGCAPGDLGPVAQSDARVRAERRAFDGAPPTVPHEDMGMVCVECHNEFGMPVEGLGFAPAEPHDGTDQMYSTGRCAHPCTPRVWCRSCTSVCRQRFGPPAPR